MNSVKLLALDLDGTLLNSQKELTPRLLFLSLHKTNLFYNGGIVGAYFPTYLNSASMPVQIQDIIAKRFAVIRHLQPFDRILK